MPSQRRDDRRPGTLGSDAGGTMVADRHAQAVEALQSLRNTIAHFSISDPADASRTATVEFDLPMSESIVTILSIVLANEQERNDKLKELYDRLNAKPSAKVLAALDELEQPGPWFRTKEELFRALEAPNER